MIWMGGGNSGVGGWEEKEFCSGGRIYSERILTKYIIYFNPCRVLSIILYICF